VSARNAVFTVAAVALAATAQAAGPSLAFSGGYFDMTGAKHSAKAVFGGSSGGVTFGGELSYGFESGFYVAAGARYFAKDGERVFVADKNGPVFPLGHPLSVRMIPVEAMVGYRFRRQTSLVPYVGIGGGMTSYRERSTVAGLTESQSASKASGRVSAGAEFGQGGIRFGVEVSYSMVPSTIGVGGVSKVYGETDIGGLSVMGRIAFGKANR
jgi:hypothetical protein